MDHVVNVHHVHGCQVHRWGRRHHIHLGAAGIKFITAEVCGAIPFIIRRGLWGHRHHGDLWAQVHTGCGLWCVLGNHANLWAGQVHNGCGLWCVLGHHGDLWAAQVHNGCGLWCVLGHHGDLQTGLCLWRCLATSHHIIFRVHWDGGQVHIGIFVGLGGQVNDPCSNPGSSPGSWSPSPCSPDSSPDPCSSPGPCGRPGSSSLWPCPCSPGSSPIGSPCGGSAAVWPFSMVLALAVALLLIVKALVVALVVVLLVIVIALVAVVIGVVEPWW